MVVIFHDHLFTWFSLHKPLLKALLQNKPYSMTLFSSTYYMIFFLKPILSYKHSWDTKMVNKHRTVKVLSYKKWWTRIRLSKFAGILAVYIKLTNVYDVSYCIQHNIAIMPVFNLKEETNHTICCHTLDEILSCLSQNQQYTWLA